MSAAPRGVRILAALGIAGTLLHFAGALTGVARDFSAVYVHLGLMVMAVLIGAVRSWRRPERWIWLTLTAGLAMWTVGEVYYAAHEPAGTSPADVFYLGAYPFFWVAFLALVRARIPRVEPDMWLDLLTCALTTAAVGAAVAHHFIHSALDADGLDYLVLAAYPVADISLAAIAVAAAAACGGIRDRTFLVLGAGFVLFTAADLVYLFQTVRGEYALGGAVDPAWTFALLLMAMAAWQPARHIEQAGRSQRLGFPVAFSGLSVGILAIDHWIRMDAGTVVLSCLSLLAVLARLWVTFAQKQRTLRESHALAMTDALTGLGNRRRLHIDLNRAAERGDVMRLVIFDLNGFKAYNDRLGHPAGDALLRRLGLRLAKALGDLGTPYRLGGDEFCVLAGAEHAEESTRAAVEALSGGGQGFGITAAWGAATLGQETQDPVHAMRLADQRMYDGKRSGRMPVQHQVREVLVAALDERRPELQRVAAEVSDLARAVGARMDLTYDEIEDIAHAAVLNDIGKLAIRDAVLDKPDRLDQLEWSVIAQHTLIGERILRTAPAMDRVAGIVRATHERFDGTGYPDGLRGERIPLGARIIAVAGAYVAMTTHRSYEASRPSETALEELRRCAGTQFDPAVVSVFEQVVGVPVPDRAVRGITAPCA
jgi:diguanylate cyclase (GGDEF)-like protein